MPRKRTKQPSREHEIMKRGNYEVGEAIRRIEQIEDELNNQGLDDFRKDLTDARADLVDALLEESLSEQKDGTGRESTHVVPSRGKVTVEVIDKISQAESQEPEVPYPEEKFFERAEILESGWVRCIRDADRYEEDTPGEDVDYYPPQLVNGIWTVDEDVAID